MAKTIEKLVEDAITMSPTHSEMFRVFGRIGLMSFGGPAAQIGVMHRELVDEAKWMSEKQFLSALSFCMLLPGPEAMQLATYAGWRMKGVAGGLMAGALFVLPGALVIACLSLLYVSYGTHPTVAPILLGIKATVIVIVFNALYKLTQKALIDHVSKILAVLAFVGIFFLSVPFPAIIFCAALVGFFMPSQDQSSPQPWPKQATSLRTILIWSTLWLFPLPVLYALDQNLLFDMSLFFAKLAVVTFGGAYAVLAYMAQEVVNGFGWLSTTQMVDALGMAETTPGPLILVTQFVGMVTGAAHGGIPMAIFAGILTLWMTFVPCFLWIFSGAPYIDAALSRPKLRQSLAYISAAVVGVILNLTLWFSLHVLFREVTAQKIGALSYPKLSFSSLDGHAIVLVFLAALILGPLKRGPLLAIPLMGGIAWLTNWV